MEERASETASKRGIEPLARPVKEVNWALRIVLVLLLLVALGLVYAFGVTVIPRWWAHRVGDRVEGSITAGAFYGLFLGFLFTLLPLLVARQLLRHIAHRWRVVILVISLGLAAPNLMTLSIVLGSSKAAHAGERVLDVEAPGFRAGSAWGAVLAVVVAVALWVWVWRWRQDRRRLEAIRSQLQAVETDRTPPSRDEQTPDPERG